MHSRAHIRSLKEPECLPKVLTQHSVARQLNWFNLKSLACLPISVLLSAVRREHVTANKGTV